VRAPVLTSTRSNLRAARRTRILDLTIVICLADIVCGIAAPTFTVYARGLGASLVLVGILAAVSGLTRLVTSIPVGFLADRVSRSYVIAAGVLAFAAAYGLFTVSSDPTFLIVPRILYALGVVATFGIGVAYIADRTTGTARDLAIGAYVSAQGIGFAVGPLVAAALASELSIANIYRLTAVLALVTAAYAWLRLERRLPPPSHDLEPSPRPRSADLLGQPPLVGVSVANLAVMLMFNGSVIPFLAVVGTKLGLDKQQIALLYGLRAIASTLSRLPAGLLAKSVSNRTVFLFAVAVDAVAALGIGFSSDAWMLVTAVVVDGIAFGVFMATSQSFIAERVSPSKVGGWLGVYSAAGAVGETVGAAAMGGVAWALGGFAVFRVAAVLLGTGLLLSWLAIARQPRAATSTATGT
jgi:MFS transporter, DHA1 family, multidrug resistance protein